MARWRAASLIGVHLLAAAHFLHWKYAGTTLAPVEPSEMFDTLHLGVITVGAIFMAGLVVATALAGRFFCGWGCHILALQDLSAWILRRLKAPTRPIRSRTLVWVPPLAALYLFVWPQVERALRGQAPAALHVVTDPDGWTSFTTDDLLRSFPGPVMTATTFIVVGLVIVYFLGTRSFCAYACPYGAIFAVADRVAPLRIVAGKGECSSCGACIASCQSSVRVIEEVREYGAVINANCMKDLDCVSVCPTDALRLGAATPPAISGAGGRRKKQYDFTRGEDALMATVFVVLLPFVRGLYEAVSFLLALAICALLAYAAVVGLRLVRADRVAVAGWRLKEAGKLSPVGRAFAAGLAILAALVAHSVYVRGHVMLGERAYARIRHDSPKHVATAIHHLEAAQQGGLVRPRGQALKLASLYERSGDFDSARTRLNELLAHDSRDHEARLQLARVWLRAGRRELAERQAQLVAKPGGESTSEPPRRGKDRRIRSAAHHFLGEIHAGEGDAPAAIGSFREALRMTPRRFDSRMALGALLSSDGDAEAAAVAFATCVELAPDSAAAHNNLAAALVQLGRMREALDHYQRCLEIAPDNVLANCNAGLLLLDLGRTDEAEARFEAALTRQPENAEARLGLERISRARRSAE